MAQSPQQIKDNYPLPVYNFRVTIGDTAMNFTEVSGISVEYGKLTYKHGLSYWEGEKIKTFYYDKYTSVTLSRGTFKGKNDLYDWLDSKETRSVDVSLCNENGEPIVTWRLAKTVPVKLEAPSFSVDSNDVSIESLELMAAGISVKHH